MKKILSIIAIILLTCFSFKTYANNSPINISLVYGGIHDNKMVVFFKIQSPHNIKTYWKISGFGGTAPQLSLTETLNINNVNVIYNIPKITSKNGITNYTFHGTDYMAVTFLPEDPSVPITFKGTLNYGYCDDLCHFNTFNFSEVFSLNQPANHDLLQTFFSSIPTPITPDMKLSINDLKATYDKRKNLLISFEIKGVDNLNDDDLIYYIDTDFEINKPIIRKKNSDSFDISLDLINIYKKPKNITLIFPNNDNKYIVFEQKILY